MHCCPYGTSGESSARRFDPTVTLNPGFRLLDQDGVDFNMNADYAFQLSTVYQLLPLFGIVVFIVDRLHVWLVNSYEV